MEAARAHRRQAVARSTVEAEAPETGKRDRACAKVRMGELTRARQLLTASEPAPGDEATFRALRDPLRRPPEPRAAIPAAALQHARAQQLRRRWLQRSATRRGGTAGFAGMRAEHLKLLLQDLTSVDLLAETATRLARAQVPADIADGLART